MSLKVEVLLFNAQRKGTGRFMSGAFSLFLSYPTLNPPGYRWFQSVDKVQRSWKREDGERNSVKYAFELGKLPLKISIDFSK